MKEKYNLQSIIAGLLLIIVGIVMVLIDIFVAKTNKAIYISIGCSLLASGMVILVQAVLVDVKRFDYAEEWGLTKIYKTRAEKNADSDIKLDKAKRQLDAVAFGLKSFRDNHTKDIERLIRKGVNIRILTMNPKDDNPFLKQREAEEKELEGQIRKSVNDLVDWANKINQTCKGKKSGTIEVKGYKCMTLDFYWRVDDEMYIGPYWYGRGSQQTITYKYENGKKGFDLYAEYFEELWNDQNNTIILTEQVIKNGRKKN